MFKDLCSIKRVCFSLRKHIRKLVMKRNGKVYSTASFFFSHGKSNLCGVVIGYYGTKKLEVINKKCGNSGRTLLSEINIDDSLFVLINISNTNNEPDLLKTLTDLDEILVCVGDTKNKNITFSGDFNVTFDYILAAQCMG